MPAPNNLVGASVLIKYEGLGFKPCEVNFKTVLNKDKSEANRSRERERERGSEAPSST